MENLFNPPKKVNLQLVGLDGNAFFLMGAFRKQAHKEGWDKEDIDRVINGCKAKDYNYLLSVLMEHTQTTDEDWEDYE